MSRRPVSIVIIAHQNHYTLNRVLSSAEASSASYDELILVLNLPSAKVNKIGLALSDRWKVLRENNPGPQHARNAGAAVSSNEYIVFLDDDVVLEAGWIEIMIKRFDSPWVAAGQGAIKFEKNHSIFWNHLKLGHIYIASAFFDRSRPATLDTAALMMSKSWFNSVGGFSRIFTVCEDTELTNRLQLHGAEFFYEHRKALTQLYNPHDTYLKHLQKIYRSGEFVVKLGLERKAARYLFFEGLVEKIKFFSSIYRRNPIFLLMTLINATVAELGRIPHIHELDSYPRLQIKSRNREKLNLSQTRSSNFQDTTTKKR